MQFDILTIFPEYFDVLKVSLLGKAISEGKLNLLVYAEVYNSLVNTLVISAQQ